MSNFLNSYFRPYRPVLPDHLVIGAGLTPVISQVTRAIADPGDGVLVIAPYYAGFNIYLKTLNGVIPVSVQVPASQSFTLEEVTCLERCLQDSTAKGMTVKAVILCNPHNPLGRCYPPEVIDAYCRFCEAHNLHLLSDEIYALSVFTSKDLPNAVPFTSILSLDLESIGVNPSRVHMFYGMSKDFCANGFRVGALTSQSNPLLIRSVTVTAISMAVSSPADELWTTLLTDTTFLPTFLNMNREKLREAYEYMTSWLKFHHLPYSPSSAGHFLMVDMRPVLEDIERYAPIMPIFPEHTMRERETVLHSHLLKHKVSITPGATYQMSEGGWFRFTFAVRRDFVIMALKRIEAALRWNAWQDNALIISSAEGLADRR